MTTRRHRRITCVAAAACLLTACASDGTLEVRVWGEAFIEEGIPSEVFVDGWALSFEHFLVAVDAIRTDDDDDGGRYVFDLTAPTGGDGHAVTSLTVPSGRPLLGYRVAPGGAADGGNASHADAQRLADGGFGLLVEGTASKGEATIAFSWGFDSATTYHDCEVVADVPADGVATTTITIHADHIFYDDLESTTPNTAFDLIAASDADADGTVTPAELRARDIRPEARYQVGSQDIDNLWDYMNALSRTVGHIDGEGECET